MASQIVQPLIQGSTAKKPGLDQGRASVSRPLSGSQALTVALGVEPQIRYDTSSFFHSRCSHQASRLALEPSSSSTQVTSSSTSAFMRIVRARSCHHPGSVYPACMCGPWRHRPEPLSPQICVLAPYPALLPPGSHRVCRLPIMLGDLTPSASLGGHAL